MRKVKPREGKGLAGRVPKPAGEAQPSFHSISANEGCVLPEQEEEAKQLGGVGRVKAENYTSQEAGFF